MKEKKIRISTILLILVIILVVIIGVCIYKVQKDKSDTNNSSVNEATTEESELNDTNNSSVNEITTDESESNDTNNFQTESIDEEMEGKWNTYRAINSEGEDENLTSIFGTAYIQLGSYLQLNEDGTFLDAINPVTDGSNSVKGTYEILRNYNKIGDCYVKLNYEDGNTKILQKIYYEDNVASLTMKIGAEEGYYLDLKK